MEKATTNKDSASQEEKMISANSELTTKEKLSDLPVAKCAVYMHKETREVKKITEEEVALAKNKMTDALMRVIGKFKNGPFEIVENNVDAVKTSTQLSGAGSVKAEPRAVGGASLDEHVLDGDSHSIDN